MTRKEVARLFDVPTKMLPRKGVSCYDQHVAAQRALDKAILKIARSRRKRGV